MDRSFHMTRETGLATLAGFVGQGAARYAADRNTDRGIDAAPTTSGLSPYLRRRLLTESEVVAAALGALGKNAAEKFVSEVFWRTYFKGHLETHPAAWDDCLARAASDRERLASAPELRGTYEAAIEGRTGIDGFDAWALELVETNWLHNHTRMWFASIWIFTLRLPWALGAAFFMRHLLDGDPASNTLSWRWVAGLHTRGKPYVARAENIRRYTDGRFDPIGLDEHPQALEEGPPPRELPLAPADPPPEGDVALLLHLDDLHAATLPLGSARVRRVSGLVAHVGDAVARVRTADNAAMADALASAAAHFACPVVAAEDGWAEGLPVVTAWAPVGPSAAALPRHALRLRRAWDETAWPHSNRGYSRLRSIIPEVLEAAAIRA